MARFINAQFGGSKTVFEFKAVARNKRTAKLNAAVSYFGRRPGKITGLEDIEAYTINEEDFVNNYTVEITVDNAEDIKNRFRSEKIAQVLDDKL